MARTDDLPRSSGTVNWFNDQKGFGFITPGTGGKDAKDIFVHFTGIRAEGKGRRTLADGQEVTFATADTPRGPQAIDVAPRD